MKTKDVQVGGIYSARVSGRTCNVKVVALEDDWVGRSQRHRTTVRAVNLRTGRLLLFKSAQRLHPAMSERFGATA